MWLNVPSVNWWDQIFCVYDGTSRFWINALGYVGYNGTGGWFDCNQNIDTYALSNATWTFITINISSTGFEVYYDGVLKFSNTNNAAWKTKTVTPFTDFTNLVNLVSTSTNFYLGYSSYWGAAPAYVDDIVITKTSLAQAAIESLYAETNVSTAIGTPISLDNGVAISTEYYTISGTKATSNYNELGTGIYIKKETYESGKVKTTKIFKERR